MLVSLNLSHILQVFFFQECLFRPTMGTKAQLNSEIASVITHRLVAASFIRLLCIFKLH